MYPKFQIEHDANNLPHFCSGYTMIISGDVRELIMDEIVEKAKTDINYNVAVYDVMKYPSTKIFVLYRAKGECYDYKCIACGKCAKVCTFDAIVPGDKYSINGNRCDECGNCYTNCPVGAIIAKGI